MLLLTGGSGELGQELQKYETFLAPSHDEFDVCNFNTEYMNAHPEITGIVHAAAATHVQAIERNDNDATNAIWVNCMGTMNIAQLAKTYHLPLYYISTETCVNPYNLYAKTKLLAEDTCQFAGDWVILRTAFRPRPFPYDTVPIDFYTIGDYIDVIAKLLIKRLKKPTTNNIEYIGTGKKTMYSLAKQTKPDIRKTTIKKMNALLPFNVQSLEELP